MSTFTSKFDRTVVQHVQGLSLSTDMCFGGVVPVVPAVPATVAPMAGNFIFKYAAGVGAAIVREVVATMLELSIGLWTPEGTVVPWGDGVLVPSRFFTFYPGERVTCTVGEVATVFMGSTNYDSDLPKDLVRLLTPFAILPDNIYAGTVGGVRGRGGSFTCTPCE